MKFGFMTTFITLFWALIFFSFSAPAQETDVVFEGRWYLTELKTKGIPVNLDVKTPYERKLSITFAADKSFGLTSTCNQMGGKYVADEGKSRGKFKTGTMFSTKMFCAGERMMEVENALAGAMEAVTKFETVDRILTLQDESGANLLRFSRTEKSDVKPESRELTLYVASKQVNCTGVAPIKCLQIKEKADDKWRLFYDRIEGFDFQGNFYYILRVKRTTIQNPPKDASGFRYELIEVLKKTKKFAKV